jgi:hypothetical protein
MQTENHLLKAYLQKSVTRTLEANETMEKAGSGSVSKQRTLTEPSAVAPDPEVN